MEMISDPDIDINSDKKFDDIVESCALPPGDHIATLVDDYFRDVNSLYPHLDEVSIRKVA